MEGSSSDPTSDWRSQVNNEFRQKLFKKIYDFMQKRVPVTQSAKGVTQLQNIVSQFEEKCFITATSQADYLRKVSIKMISIEQKSQRISGVGSSSKNLDVGNQNHDSAASSLAHPSHVQQQQLPLQPNEFEPSKQPNTQLATSFQSDEVTFQSPTQCNRQQSQLNSIQRPSPSQAQQHQPVGRPQQNQLMGQQSNISTRQSQLQAKQNELTSMQLVTQHQSNSSQSGRQQQRQFMQSQRECPEVTSSIAVDSTTKTINAGMADIQEEIYQKIESMKTMYLPELEEYYQETLQKIQQFQASKPSGDQLEQHNKSKIIKHNLESIIKLLHISKDNIQSGLREKLPLLEKRITNFMVSQKSKKNVLLESQGQQQFQQLDKHGQSMPENQSSLNSPTHLNNHTSSAGKMKLQGESAPVRSNIDPTQKSSFGFLQNSAGAPLSQNKLQSNSSSMQPGSNVQQDQNLQFHTHKKQKLTQQSQTQIQPVPPSPVHQRSSLHHMNDGNEHMARRDSDIRSLLYRQPKPGTPVQASPSQKLQSPSPRVFHNLHSQNDRPKSGARSQHANSALNVSSVPNAADAANIAHQGTSLRETQVPPLAILTPGTSPSPLLEDFGSPQTCQVNALEAHPGELSVTERPIEKLIKTIQSSSHKTLSSCMSNISSVVTLIDTMAGCVSGNGSRSEVGIDLSLSAQCNLQARNLMLQDGYSTKKRLRHMTSMPMKASDCFDQIYGLDTSEPESSATFDQIHSLDTSEPESTATSNVEEQKTKINPSVLEEIKDINRKLIDTSEPESTATSNVKEQKTKINPSVLEEIKDINRKLIDTSEPVSTATSNVKEQKTKINPSVLEEIKDINRKLIDTSEPESTATSNVKEQKTKINPSVLEEIKDIYRKLIDTSEPESTATSNVKEQKTKINPSVLEEIKDIYRKLIDTSEPESTATSNVKEQKTKINPSVLEEIKDINRKLIDTSEPESTATSNVKEQKTKINPSVLEEIKDINRKLIDTSEPESTATSNVKEQKTKINPSVLEEIKDINQNLIDTSEPESTATSNVKEQKTKINPSVLEEIKDIYRKLIDTSEPELTATSNVKEQKTKINPSVLEEIKDIYRKLIDTSEPESTATSNVKEQKTKINPSVLEEIKDINRKLMDTVVDIDEDGVIKCIFTPVAFTSDLKSMLSQHKIMPLRLRAPSNYPDSSPVILDKLPDKAREEKEELYFKIQERFQKSIERMSHPVSLGEMVRTWSSSIREVVNEFAKKFGGGSFGLTYCGWQKCVARDYQFLGGKGEK